ncbi:hypothetical protein Cni_G12494 [Canna indica]|uniref:Uncharacterized protein n=1 Tax=Canna indica TaxID=4628 RepID=A0AAQ3K8C8_9LILI|nr:hypothetical protein Cni_G12494 [Canna indica]
MSTTSSDDLGNAFDMGSLKTHLPKKRKGLSKYFAGESKSFTCIADAKSVDDLEKMGVPERKRRKYSERRGATCHSLVSSFNTEMVNSNACRHHRPHVSA